jgi:RHS repeat-associated protein
MYKTSTIQRYLDNGSLDTSFDGDGYLITENVYGSITATAVTADGHFLAAGGGTLAEYHIPGTWDERIYALHDANYNITAITNVYGDVVERYQYDPCGERTIIDGTWSTTRSYSIYDMDRGYQGLWEDPVTGWKEADWRWLTNLGVWNRPDPSGTPDGPNRYLGYGGNPVNGRDPSGLKHGQFETGSAEDQALTHIEQQIEEWPLQTEYAPNSISQTGLLNFIERTKKDIKDLEDAQPGLLAEFKAIFSGELRRRYHEEEHRIGDALRYKKELLLLCDMELYRRESLAEARELERVGPVMYYGFRAFGPGQGFDQAMAFAGGIGAGNSGAAEQKSLAMRGTKAGVGRNAALEAGLRIRGPLLGQEQGREFRVDQLELFEFEPNAPSHVRGWLQNERRRIEQGRADSPRTPSGYQLGHGRTTPAREGYDYSNARLQGEDLNLLEELIRRQQGKR